MPSWNFNVLFLNSGCCWCPEPSEDSVPGDSCPGGLRLCPWSPGPALGGRGEYSRHDPQPRSGRAGSRVGCDVCSNFTDQTRATSSGWIYPPDLLVWEAGRCCPGQDSSAICNSPVLSALPSPTGCQKLPLLCSQPLLCQLRAFPWVFSQGGGFRGSPGSLITLITAGV